MYQQGGARKLGQGSVHAAEVEPAVSFFLFVPFRELLLGVSYWPMTALC